MNTSRVKDADPLRAPSSISMSKSATDPKSTPNAPSAPATAVELPNTPARTRKSRAGASAAAGKEAVTCTETSSPSAAVPGLADNVTTLSSSAMDR